LPACRAAVRQAGTASLVTFHWINRRPAADAWQARASGARNHREENGRKNDMTGLVVTALGIAVVVAIVLTRKKRST